MSCREINENDEQTKAKKQEKINILSYYLH